MICKRFLLQWPKLKKQHDAFAAVVLFFDWMLLAAKLNALSLVYCLRLLNHPKIPHNPYGKIKIHEILPFNKTAVRNLFNLPHPVQQRILMDMQVFRNFSRLSGLCQVFP